MFFIDYFGQQLAQKTLVMGTGGKSAIEKARERAQLAKKGSPNEFEPYFSIWP